MKRNMHRIMAELQNKQFRHDFKAHRDLLSFDIYSKIKHMTLHFAKYAGKIQRSLLSNDSASIENSLLDTFIICMATANALNKNLGDSFTDRDFEDLNHFIRELNAPLTPANFLASMIIDTGSLAKAIESTDHMEFGNPRELIEISLQSIFSNTLKAISYYKTDTEKLLDLRFEKIENNQIVKL